MTKNKNHLLIIEDDKVDQMAFERFAKSPEFEYTYQLVGSISEAKKVLKKNKYDAIVSDFFLGDGTCFEILDLNVDIPIVVVTGTGSEETAVKALKKGAYDYLIKDVDGYYLTMLPITVQNALKRFESEKKLIEYQNNLEKLIEIRTSELKKEMEARKLATENLKINEIKYRSLFENAPLPYHSLNENGEFVDVNPAWLKILGYKRNDVVGKKYEDFLHVDLHEHFKNKFPVFKECGYVNTFFKLKHKKGHYLDVQLEGSIGYNIDGSFKQTYCVFNDITERNKYEEKIRKLSTAVEQSPSVIVITDIEGNIEYVNPKFEHLTAYTKEEVLGKNVRTLKSGIQPHEYYDELWESLKVNNEWHGEFNNKKKNGDLFWESASISPIFNEDGIITNYIKVAEDITDRKRAEDELKSSEERFKQLVGMLPEAVFETDEKFNMTYVNERALEISGYASEDIIHKMTGLDLLIPEDRIRAKENISIRLKGVNPGTIEYNAIRKDGSIFPILFHANSIIRDGKLVGLRGIIIDITEIKNSEESLRESENKMRSIYRAAPTGIGVTLDRMLIEVNPKFCEITGYTEKELIGNCSSMLYFTQKDFEKIGKKKYNLIKKFGTGVIETKWKKKDGSSIDIILSSTPIDTKDVSKGITFTALDVTERNKSEKALIDSEEKFRKAFLTSPDSININRLEDGKYVSINSGFTKIMGYSEEDVLGKTSIELDVWKNARDRRRLISGLKKRGVVENLEAQFYSKNREIKDGLMSASIIELNGLPHILNITRDITARKRAEHIQKVLYNISNAVITSESLEELIANIKIQLNNIIDTTNYYIALYDEKTDTFSLPFMTDEKDMLDSFPAEKTVTGYVIKTGKPLIAKKQAQKRMAKNGDIKIVGSLSEIWLGVPLKTEGKVIGVLAVQSYTDENAFDESDMVMLEFVSEQISISIERKKVEQDLKLALEKATESDRLKSAFLATMSHELRTPLNAIIGFSDIINEEVSIEDIVSFNKNINSSGYHLLSIVEDLFDITLIETGQTRLNLADVNVYTILNEVQEIILIEQLKTNKNHIEIKRKYFSKKEELIIHIDASKLKQILINLLKNALKFTNEGSVSYGFEIVKIHQKSMLKFYVKDTGIGIPKEKQELVFDVFRQVEDSNTRVYGGTGIGLSISKKITELLGGNIWLESDEGKGSSFYFTIPLKMERESDVIVEDIEIVTEKKNNILEKKTVLITEDVEESLLLLKILVEGFGYDTLEAKNGLEALNQCKENKKIDLVLMDVNMPVMNGYEATMEIKKFRPNLPIISQTAYATLGDKQKSMDAGCDDYISKPIKKELLLEKIKHFF